MSVTKTREHWKALRSQIKKQKGTPARRVMITLEGITTAPFEELRRVSAYWVDVEGFLVEIQQVQVNVIREKKKTADTKSAKNKNVFVNGMGQRVFPK